MLDKTEKLLFYYENLVNWKKRLSKEGPFLCKVLKERGSRRILDVGCGIGKHVLYLRNHGYDAHGSDLNPLHFKRAKELAAKEDSGANFFHEDMKVLENQEDESYDAVMSLGNTLSSLGFDGVKQVLSTFSRVLKPGGIVIGQVLNYNSFQKEDFSDVRSSYIEGKEIINVKTFHFEETHILMVLNVLTRSGEKWDSLVSATKMYQLERDFIERELKEQGFGDIRFFGSLSGEAFDYEKSKDLVFVAGKEKKDA